MYKKAKYTTKCKVCGVDTPRPILQKVGDKVVWTCGLHNKTGIN